MSLGSPIALEVVNRDYKLERLDDLPRPRPGHADLTGSGEAPRRHPPDARTQLERPRDGRPRRRRRAREAAARRVRHHSRSATSSSSAASGSSRSRATIDELIAERDREKSIVYAPQHRPRRGDQELIDKTGKSGDTLGGIVEVRVDGLPFGLGTHAQWSRKLDGRLAQAVMAVQAIKGVEIGLGLRDGSPPRFAGARPDPLR